MRAHPLRTVALGFLASCLVAVAWVCVMDRDAPPGATVTGAHLRWVRGMNGNGPAGSVRLSRADAKRLEHLIAAAPDTPFSGTTSCPMDTGHAIHAQFTNGYFSYPTFTIKLDGCSGTPNHQMSAQLTAFLDAHAPR